jgi:Flp pilus assembly protein TadB
VRPEHLRHAVAVVLAIILLVAFVNVVSGGRSLVMAGVIALFVILLIVFEVRSYRPKVDRKHGSWKKTSESFADPITGEHTDVFFNRETGERDYRHHHSD